VTPQQKRVKQQLADAAQFLPPDQALLLLRLVQAILADPDDKTWAWALCLDADDGGNGKCTL
jgi:hypothetical protein